MPKLTAMQGDRAALRQHAQQKLNAGIAPSTRGWGVSVEALELLHRLASAPASAADALKLLHELQVHQVELDLQHAQLEAGERELGDGLARYRVLFEQAPVAYFSLDGLGQVEECNHAGADLLGVSAEEACGRPFTAFLSAEGRLRFAGLLAALRGGSRSPSCSVSAGSGGSDSPNWRLTVSGVPGGEAILLVVTQAAVPPER